MCSSSRSGILPKNSLPSDRCVQVSLWAEVEDFRLPSLQEQVEELQTSREAAASAELQTAHEAAQASLAQAEAAINGLKAEKDNLAKRCVPRIDLKRSVLNEVSDLCLPASCARCSLTNCLLVARQHCRAPTLKAGAGHGGSCVDILAN